jgi:glycosyltransferase involved in cell wall biosynthesis
MTGGEDKVTTAASPAQKVGPSTRSDENSKVAVLIPCLNEEKTIGKVVRDFRSSLPEAEVYVFDNASVDRTAEEAREAGALVFSESRRGKGFVVQAMFQRVDADVYILVDGDDTYPAVKARELIAPILSGEADMVVGSRLARGTSSEFRYVNWFGNKIFLHMINSVFRTSLTDILSGFRAMNKGAMRGIPLFVRGFDIEAELVVKALQRGYRIVEVPVDLRPRPQGSYSKVRAFRDGWQILSTILALMRDYKPFTFFGSIALPPLALGLVLATRVLQEYPVTGLAHQLPSIVIAMGLLFAALMSMSVGLVLHTVDRRFQEMEYYLRLLVR